MFFHPRVARFRREFRIRMENPFRFSDLAALVIMGIYASQESNLGRTFE